MINFILMVTVDGQNPSIYTNAVYMSMCVSDMLLVSDQMFLYCVMFIFYLLQPGPVVSNTTIICIHYYFYAFCNSTYKCKFIIDYY